MKSTILRSSILSSLLVALITVVAAVSDANACGQPSRQNKSMLAGTLAGRTAAAQPGFVSRISEMNSGDPENITGFWETQFIVGGELYDDIFQQFHADGNENSLSGPVPPAVGNVCLGYWKRGLRNSFQLRHYFWVYDDTNTVLIGKGYIAGDNIKINRQGTQFTGTFIIQFRDFDGHPIPAWPDASGTLLGTRMN